MRDIRRTYAIERDEQWKPYRMVWTGDYRRVPILYVTCPRCVSSPRLVQGRCFRCWGDFRGEYREVRA